MMARRWRGTVRAEHHDAYLRYVEITGIAALTGTPGNERAIVFRHLDEASGTSEIDVASLSRDLASIEAFAGADISVPRFFPDDDLYLVERELTVRHDEVERYSAATGRGASGRGASGRGASGRGASG